MNDTEFSDVKRRLRPADVFQGADHEWKTQSSSRWKGTCPWHDSSSGSCFTVNPETLEWHCFHCERGGGPLQYVAELESIGTGARGTLKGKEFFRAWKALSRHAGCEGPPDQDSEGNGGEAGSDRRPLRNPKKRTETTRRKRGAAATEGAPEPPPRPRPKRGTQPTLSVPESELREALSRYREALKSSEKARAYVEGRGLSVGALHAYGCGYAAPGDWIGQDNAPRLVTPHTTPDGRLVNLSGRYLGECDPGQRHRHIGGNPTALFNASAVQDGSGPLVLCEGPLDALSFIEAGHDRAAALHNTDGVPWGALRGNASVLVFAFDADGTGREDANERAIEATRRGYDAHTLHDEAAYRGHGDPNEAQQSGALSLDYLRKIGRDGAAAEDRETAADRSGPEADRSPTSHDATTGADEGQATAADLAGYWNGGDIGHLGRWLWERGGVPEGDVGAGLYADRELHVWIKEQLEAGPHGTTEQTQIRLRWVLWRLYAAHGPEEVPEGQIPIPPMRRG
jgi:hypothetical protein